MRSDENINRGINKVGIVEPIGDGPRSTCGGSLSVGALGTAVLEQQAIQRLRWHDCRKLQRVTDLRARAPMRRRSTSTAPK
jgi:hypothetical protein